MEATIYNGCNGTGFTSQGALEEVETSISVLPRRTRPNGCE